MVPAKEKKKRSSKPIVQIRKFSGVFTDHLKGQGLTHSDRAEFRCQLERGLSQISQGPSEEGGRGRVD